jgi:hypothetical protein
LRDANCPVEDLRIMKTAIVLIAAICGLMFRGLTASAQNLFFDNLDLDTSANYTVSSDADTLATFAYNYSALGIPSAPNSVGGSTIGLKLEANNGDATAAAAAIGVSPAGRTFIGDITLRFDMWINANGPFPGGGVGSTQFVTAGVGTAGNTIHKSSGNADGTWFGVDGEGGSGIDYRIYLGTGLQTPDAGFYAAGTAADARNAANSYYTGRFPGQGPPQFQQDNFPQQTGNVKDGSVGFAWRQVEIAKLGSGVTWSIDGALIGNVPSATFSGDNVFVGFWDAFTSISDNPTLSFGLIDNLRVIQAVPEPSAVALACIAAFGLFAIRRRN